MDICLGVVAHAGVHAELPGQQDLGLGLEAAALPAEDHGPVRLDDDVVRRQPRLRVRGEHQAAAVVDDNLDALDDDRVRRLQVTLHLPELGRHDIEEDPLPDLQRVPVLGQEAAVPGLLV